MNSKIGRLPWNEFWEVLSRSPSRALLGQHDDLPARLVLLHAAMGLSDLVEVEGFADLDMQCARCDLLDQILEQRPHEIFRFASIGGEADRRVESHVAMLNAKNLVAWNLPFCLAGPGRLS
jgi:hypothetical protein